MISQKNVRGVDQAGVVQFHLCKLLTLKQREEMIWPVFSLSPKNRTLGVQLTCYFLSVHGTYHLPFRLQHGAWRTWQLSISARWWRLSLSALSYWWVACYVVLKLAVSSVVFIPLNTKHPFPSFPGILYRKSFKVFQVSSEGLKIESAEICQQQTA